MSVTTVRTSRCLGPAQPLIVLEAAGLHDSREPHESVEAEAAGHVTELLRAREGRASGAPDEPVLLAGHSWGGLVAYEMAVQLDRGGVPVSVFLIDAGTNAPVPVRQRLARLARERSRVAPTVRRHVGLAIHLPRVVLRRLRPEPDPVQDPSPRARYDLFERRGAASGARYQVPPAVFPVTLGLSVQSRRADFWRSRVARLEAVQLTGSHNGLQPPNVKVLAEQMEAAFRRPAPAHSL